MAYSAVPTRDTLDTNSFADINQLQENITSNREIAIANSLTRTIISNNSVDSDHDLDFAEGYEVDSTGVYQLGPQAMTKLMDAAFTAGDGNGGNFNASSLSANTQYKVYKLRKDSDASIDYGCDTYAAGVTNLPAGYTYYAYIGSFKTDSSGNIIQFLQTDRYFWYKTLITDYNANDPGTSAVLVTLTVPPETIAIVNYNISNATAGTASWGLMTSTFMTDTVPTETIRTLGSSNTNRYPNSRVMVYADASSQIRVRLSFSNASIDERVNTIGYEDIGLK